MRKKNKIFWACDFETTVWGPALERARGKKQDETEVWSAAYVQLYDEKEDVHIDGNIETFLSFFFGRQSDNDVLYFHNLSFDGSFIVDWLLRNKYTHVHTDAPKDMKSNTFTTSISHMGEWYRMYIKKGRCLLEIRNSFKLIPSSLKTIGKSFATRHQKLDMEYEGERHANCEITPEEREYIRNDVLVLKEALEKMFNEGHNKLTIGSCCLSEFKAGYSKKDYSIFFPNLQEEWLDERYAGAWNQDEYVRKSYHGGWCYVNPKFQGRLIEGGQVYDVNSLYPSVMSTLKYRYPVGYGMYYPGLPDTVRNGKNNYYFVRFRCRFRLKKGCFPWVHIRGNPLYLANENLVTTDVRYRGQYYRYYRDIDGNICDTRQEFTMTGVDFELFLKTYTQYDMEILDCIDFRTEIGLFDDYIEKYRTMKETSTGFRRTLAKLFSNNLYGKMGASDDSSYKEPYLDSETGILRFHTVEEHNKDTGYIPCGSAITSYALNFTYAAAMKNRGRFCYADTDSVHLSGLTPADNIPIDSKKYGHWKNELTFSSAYYERQKVYCEIATHENGELLDRPKTVLKCAGMTRTAREKFEADGMSPQELCVGLTMPESNLKAERVRGGIVLRKKDFQLRKSVDKHVRPAI